MTEDIEAGLLGTDSDPPITGKSDLKSSRRSEHDLYPKVGEFLFNSLSCLSMRIDENRSSNRKGPRGNKWLYPDIVGLIDLTSSWTGSVKELASGVGADQLRLVSLEVKRTVNRSNVREVVFQTVSNSSWAHQAYLVAETLNSSAADELRILCLAHNIGFIELNYFDPSESQIIIPAKLRDDINFETLSRLVEENSDAQTYMQNISNFLKIRHKDWSLDWNLVPEDTLED